MLSLRMRASLGGRHVSGAERIVRREELDSSVLELLHRPKLYDSLTITVESLKEIHYIEKAMEITNLELPNYERAREEVVELLSYKIDRPILRKTISTIAKGAAPSGGNMRGAMLVDIDTGQRLEPDRERGVRTVRVDWEKRKEVMEALLREGYTERTLDALALATKNAHCGILAELCWSDDEDYLTGYVASPELGYVRIYPLKKLGDPFGGRAYFIRRGDLQRVIECLRERAFLIKSL